MKGVRYKTKKDEHAFFPSMEINGYKLFKTKFGYSITDVYEQITYSERNASESAEYYKLFNLYFRDILWKK
jgi:hypothetical protein